jgi:hypothetical protein
VATGSQIAKLTASDADAEDFFGVSVAVSGSTALVGARFDDDAGSDSGSAYLFDVATGSQKAKLTASDAAAGDRFGRTVAISGATALVGASGNSDAGESSGSAYVFERSDVAGRYYVDADANGANDGSSWADAFNYLQDALAAARSEPNIEEIWVAEGVYRPDEESTHPHGTGDREATFELMNGVAIRGGYAGYGELEPDERDPNVYETVLSGDLAGDDPDGNDPCGVFAGPPNAENSHHVITSEGTDETGVLDGFTISGGNANGSGDLGNGGGMYNKSGKPTVSNCTIKYNRAKYNGGGIYNKESSPLLTNCVFYNNDAANYNGGAIYNEMNSSPVMRSCIFSRNTAGDHGGGIHNTGGSTAIVSDCEFIENRAGGSGGGITVWHNSDANLTECTFIGNSSGNPGGGVNIYESRVRLRGCTLIGNSGSHGGGMYNLNDSNATVAGCTFRENWSTYPGGGICNSSSSITVADSNFVGNWTELDSGGGLYNNHSTATVSNCGFVENSASVAGGGIYNSQSSCTLINCNISGNSAGWYGGGMFNLFTDSTVVKCQFKSNSGGRFGGGGIYCLSSSSTVVDCTFRRNRAEYQGSSSSNSQGGGIRNIESTLVLTNCTFEGNFAEEEGGGIYNFGQDNTSLSGCILSGNQAIETGGGIFCQNGKLAAINCTFAGNSALDGSALACDSWNQARPSSIEVTSCILWDGGDEIWDNDGSTITIAYSDVEGGWDGEGNIDDDPCFADPCGADYHLLEASPCIDTGDPSYMGDADVTDLDGEARLMGCRVDMGADEFTVVNSGPIACIMGGDRVVEAGVECEARVELDGSCSSDEDSTEGTNDDINDFDWYEVIDACDPNGDIYLGSGEVIECNLGLGEHLIILEVTDRACAFDTNEVVITVEDTTAPLLTLNGAETVILECGMDSYVEEGATATDNCEEDVAVVTGGDVVDTLECGTYVVTYDVTDSSGNSGEQVIRMVVVEDTMPPEFSLVVEPNTLWPPNG